jgi:hypothetical protein
MGSSFASTLNFLRFLIPFSWMIIHLVRYGGIKTIPTLLSFWVGFSLSLFFLLDFTLNSGIVFLWEMLDFFPKIFPTLFAMAVWSLLGLVFISVQPELTKVKRKLALRLPILGALFSYFFQTYYMPIVVILGVWVLLGFMLDRFRSVFYLYSKMMIFLILFFFFHQNTSLWIWDLLLFPALFYLGIIVNQLLVKDMFKKVQEI